MLIWNIHSDLENLLRLLTIPYSGGERLIMMMDLRLTTDFFPSSEGVIVNQRSSRQISRMGTTINRGKSSSDSIIEPV